MTIPLRSSSATRFAGLTVGGSLAGGGGADSGSIFAGNLGPITIGHDLQGGSGDGSAGIYSGGTLASLTVGGSLLAGAGKYYSDSFHYGQIFAAAIGRVAVAGNVQGGPGVGSAEIHTYDSTGTTGTIGSVNIAGSLCGGAGQFSGQIQTSGDLGPVTIGHNVQGGSGPDAGEIYSYANLRSVSVGGSLLGAGASTGIIGSVTGLGPIVIGHDIQGGSGQVSGVIECGDKLASLTVGGSLIGSAYSSGLVDCNGDIGPVKIGHDMHAGANDDTGIIFAGGSLARLAVGGSIYSNAAAPDDDVAIQATVLGPIVVGGSLVGNATRAVLIRADGPTHPVPPHALAIASLTVHGYVQYANILAGDDPGNPSAGDAQIGPVTVGGDWIASNLAAGVQPGADGFYGTADDTATNAGNPAIVSSIVRIAIGGQVIGVPFALAGGGPHYGFVAQQIGRFTIHGVAVPLRPGPGNDLTPRALGSTYYDVTVREVPLS